jgi:hypothetical protein
MREPGGLAAPTRRPGLGALTKTRQSVEQPRNILRLVVDTLVEIGDGKGEDTQIAGDGVIGEGALPLAFAKTQLCLIPLDAEA